MKQNFQNEGKSPQQSTRRSFSISSLLNRSTPSRSPDRARHVFSGHFNDSKVSFTLSTSAAKLAEHPVKREDFADSDSSHESIYTDEEIQSAESIYSVIQEYEVQRQSFRFNEDFENSSEGSFENTETVQPNTKKRTTPPSIPEEGQEASIPRATGSRDAQSIIRLKHTPLVADRRLQSTRRPFSRMNRNQQGVQLPEPNISPLVDTHALNATQNISPEVMDFVEEEEESSILHLTDLSLSSGELLSRLDMALPRSAQSSKRNSVTSELALQTLIAGVDLDTELPVMVYTVQDKNSPHTRWSVYDKPPNVTQAQASRHPTAIPIQMRDGTRLARRISLLTMSNPSSRSNSNSNSKGSLRLMATAEKRSRSGSVNVSPAAYNRLAPFLASAHRASNGLLMNSLFLFGHSLTSSGSTPGAESGGANMSSPGVFSNLSHIILEDEGKEGENHTDFAKRVLPCENVLQGNPAENSRGQKPLVPASDARFSQPYIASPAPSVTRDSIEHQRHHRSMFSEEDLTGGNPAQQERLLTMPWSKWLTMMFFGLVAVPVFFLLPLGVFDRGGFWRSSDTRILLDEKTMLPNWRFQRKYSRTQKTASLVIGVVWILVVLAMIGVGFGIGLTRSHPNRGLN